MRVFNKIQFIKDLVDYRFELEYKNKKRFPLREMSKEVGISTSTLSRIYNGGKADIDTVIALCHVMNKSIDSYLIKP